MAISIGRAVAVSYRHTDILFISEPLSFNQIGNNNITSIDTAATNNFTDIKLKKKLKKYSISNTLFNFNCNENDHNVNLNKNIKYKENNKYNFQNQYKIQNKNHNQSLKIINNCCCCINCTNIKLLEKFKNLNISSNILLQKQKHCKHLKISSSKKHCKFIKRKLVKCNKHKKVICCKINHCIEIKTEIKTQIVKNSIKKISDKTIINPLKKEIEFAFEALTMNDIHKNGTNGPIMTTSGDKREHLYKILIIGELGTGKTSFIKRYVHKFFSQNYRATIGVDFALKVLHWDQNTIIRLQLWDIAGQERFGNMTRVYYKDAVGAFIVFDVTRSGTFECVSKWKEDLDSKVQLPDGSPIPCILLANKCDQEKQGLVTNPDKMDEYVKENGFAGWFETSAKENINIDESARALVNKILLNDKLISAADLDAEKIDLGGSSGYGGSGGKKKECAC